MTGQGINGAIGPSWRAPSASMIMGRSYLSVIADLRVMSGMLKICSWNSGARRRRDMTWVTRARVVPSRRAISALFWTSPASICRLHSMAMRRSSVTREVLEPAGLRMPRADETTRTTWSASIRRDRVPTSQSSRTPRRPNATSTPVRGRPPGRCHFGGIRRRGRSGTRSRGLWRAPG